MEIERNSNCVAKRKWATNLRSEKNKKHNKRRRSSETSENNNKKFCENSSSQLLWYGSRVMDKPNASRLEMVFLSRKFAWKIVFYDRSKPSASLCSWSPVCMIIIGNVGPRLAYSLFFSLFWFVIFHFKVIYFVYCLPFYLYIFFINCYASLFHT